MPIPVPLSVLTYEALRSATKAASVSYVCILRKERGGRGCKKETCGIIVSKSLRNTMLVPRLFNLNLPQTRKVKEH